MSYNCPHQSVNGSARSEEMSPSLTQQIEKSHTDATCSKEKPHVESESYHEESSASEQQPTTNQITLVKGQRGNKLLTTGNQKYKQTNHLPNIDKSYWICVEPNCLARAVTQKRHVKHTYGLHTCKSKVWRSQEQDTNSCEEKNGKSTDTCCLYVTDDRGSKLLAIGNQRYKLTRNLPAIKKTYWLCARPGCPARAITISGRLENTTGSHVCHSSGTGNDISADTALKFTIGMRGNSKVLVLDERSYRCKYSSASTNRTYWKCVHASFGCPAKLVTIAGRLASITNDVHTCTANAKTVKSDAKLDAQKPGAKRKKPAVASHHSDGPEKPPPSKKRKILRQSNKLASRSLPVQEGTAKVIEETATISREMIDEREARVTRKAPQAKRSKRTIRPKRVEHVDNTATYSDFEQVKRMAHLQPRVMIARFLTTAIEKLSVRQSLVHETYDQVDNTLALNTVSIAKLSLT